MNYAAITRWLDGKEGKPPFGPGGNPDPEIRGDLGTPLASSLDSIREWLSTGASDVGPTRARSESGQHLLRPPHRLPPVQRHPAHRRRRELLRRSRGRRGDAHHTCTNGGAWNTTTLRCEKDSSPKGTSAVNVYVIAFGKDVTHTVLDGIAAAGGTTNAYFPTSRSDLTAALADIVARSLPKATCDCDGECDGEAQVFPDKGKTCSVGVGRCKRAGVFACNAAADGTACSSTGANICPATPLVAGAPVMEQCGVAPGPCLAPTLEDCMDDNCDGFIDENLSCVCNAKPEICNGLDDNCNNVVDDIQSVPCGIDVGICKPGMTKCAPDGQGGVHTVCDGGTTGHPEDCNGADDNCNGIVDDVAARVCYPDGSAGCALNPTTKAYECKGQCQPGVQSCVMGAWEKSPCLGAVTPMAEIPCDKRDNNCDGAIDESDPGPGRMLPAQRERLHGRGRQAHLRRRVQSRAQDLRSDVGRGHLRGSHHAQRRGLRRQGQQLQRHDRRGLRRRRRVRQRREGPCFKTGKKVCNTVGTGTICNAGAAVPEATGEMRSETCDGTTTTATARSTDSRCPRRPEAAGAPWASASRASPRASPASGLRATSGPTPEICDGKDNNCNGSSTRASPSRAEGRRPRTAGGTAQGECRAGASVCLGPWAGTARAASAPRPRSATTRTTTATARLTTAMCPAGGACVLGECIPPCRADEVGNCPADRTCRDGFCIRKACALMSCPAGQFCDAEGKCQDFCADVHCPTGTRCNRGLCVDCHNRGCMPGQICRAQTASPILAPRSAARPAATAATAPAPRTAPMAAWPRSAAREAPASRTSAPASAARAAAPSTATPRTASASTARAPASAACWAWCASSAPASASSTPARSPAARTSACAASCRTAPTCARAAATTPIA